jgi:tetratricopeptide (TPR) repeat protein
VDHPFTAALAEGDGVKMSDLVLLHPARALTDPLAIINDGRVTIDKLAAHLAVFPAAASSAPRVTFGIADRVDGQLLVKSEATLSKGTAQDESAADAVLDLALLPPGKYMAVAIVTDGARRIGARYQPLYVERPASARGAAAPKAVGTAGAAPRVRFVPNLSSTLVKTFARGDVLAPAALGYFANRLAQADAAPPAAVASALADFRDARFDVVLDTLSRASSDGLSAAFLKGVALLGKGQPQPAVAELKKALRAADDFLPAAFYLGACYAALGKDEMAVGAWQTALATEGDARIVYDVLVDALLRLNDAEQAIQVLDEAQGRWPEDEAFLSRRAAAQAMQGRRADAVATLGRYLDAHRTDTEAAALAIRLIYEARAAGQTLTSLQSDREAAARYGEWYHAAGGANAALVDRWLEFIRK